MSFTNRSKRALSSRIGLLVAVSAIAGVCLADNAPPRAEQPNYEQAMKYSSEYLRQFVYDTQVAPHWVGKTDVFWYSYRTSAGRHWYRVTPKLALKEPLFDCSKLGAQLSEIVQKPLDCDQLPLMRESINDEGTKFKFVVDDYQYEYDLQGEKLTKLGKAPPGPAFGAGAGGRRGFGRGNFQQFQQQQQELQQQQQQQRDTQQIQQQQQQNDQQNQQQTTRGRRGRGLGGRGGRGGAGGRGGDYRNFSPDNSMYVFARNHNLYLVVVKKEPEKTEPKKTEQKSDDVLDDDQKDAKKEEPKKEEPAKKDPDADAIQLTTDGVEDYDFGGGFGGGGLGRGRGVGQNNNATTQPVFDPNRKMRANVTWSKDSKAFFTMRVDRRGVQELWVMNSLSQPRHTIEKYKYSMPGEDAVPKTELYVFTADSKKLKRVPPKWVDEGYGDTNFGKTGEDLRFVRHDRLLRHDDLCSMNTKTGKIKPLIAEAFENANLVTEAVTYVEGTDEMIWWSERSGWAHYYLYDHDGNLKNPITAGTYRSGRILDLDPTTRLLYFIGNGREPGENVYYEHLYRVHLDGADLVLMDPGNATHQSSLSPSKSYLVDNWSRVDQQPVSWLRDSSGRDVLELERADLSQLQSVG